MAAPSILTTADASAARPADGADPGDSGTDNTRDGVRPPLRWLAAAGRAVNFVLLMVALFAALVLILAPKATGSQTYAVLTNSMAPKYSPGTYLVVKPTAFSELQAGDVITFQLESGKPAVETHRIVGFGTTQTGEKTLITKGDNNDTSDPNPVREPQVNGKLFYAVPYAGYVANALGNSDRGLWVTVGAAGLIGYGALLIFRNVRSRRREAGTAA
ncbi:signal peptidase I [Arthrobacter sp. QXT-31]|uniref:signal peptidase I n=1 Tax=Arthrobacter sp. QXT-31 TaxID=1357915 RepID=UPI000971A1C1|nr:signal peptidase I [Arthrobacter sp. QXT-31]APX01283.1 signal peptidase I [Arthrobacter sp. QXT-31]